jgi:hypothetical protein
LVEKVRVVFQNQAKDVSDAVVRNGNVYVVFETPQAARQAVATVKLGGDRALHAAGLMSGLRVVDEATIPPADPLLFPARLSSAIESTNKANALPPNTAEELDQLRARFRDVMDLLPNGSQQRTNVALSPTGSAAAAPPPSPAATFLNSRQTILSIEMDAMYDDT